MNTHSDKTQENKGQSVSNAISQKSSSGESTFQFVDNRPEAIAQRKLQEIANNHAVVQRYDIKAFDSWEEHWQWLLTNHIDIPANIALRVDHLETFVDKLEAGTKALYIPPNQEGLTAEGIQLRDSKERGAIILSMTYVTEIGNLPSEERVSALISTIRHELQHAANLLTEIVPLGSNESEANLDEVIAHCENILNTQLDGNKSDAPLWDQVDHLCQAEDYMEKVKVEHSPLLTRATESLQAAKTKLDEELSEYGDPVEIITNYLNGVDFAHENTLTLRSSTMNEILN